MKREMTIAEFRDLAAVKSARGRKRKRSGDATEALVERHNAECVRAEIAADLFKVPTPTRQIARKQGQAFRAVHAAKAGVDYVGVMGRAGRRPGTAVYVEVKRCSAARFQLREVAPQQRDALTRCDEAGGFAVLLVVYGPDLATATLCACPWDLVAERIAVGDKSLSRADLATWAVPRGTPYLAAPWVTR
jgi:hypothetical protein